MCTLDTVPWPLEPGMQGIQIKANILLIYFIKRGNASLSYFFIGVGGESLIRYLPSEYYIPPTIVKQFSLFFKHISYAVSE